MEHITLPILSEDATREVRKETLEVEPDGVGRYRLLHSPAFVDGIAAGDVIELVPDTLEGYRVVTRSGNLAVVLVFPSEDAKISASDAIVRAMGSLGGVVDGGPRRVVVCSVPIAAGFARIEAALQALCTSPGTTWWFGNVYSPAGTLLGWWE